MKKYALRLLAPLFALFLLLPSIPKGYATTSFVASVNSDVYHVSSCFYVDRIKESNRIWFTSAEEAEASGRRGCSHCQPEQYKSSPSQESQEDPAQSPQEQSQPNSSVQSTQQETPSTSAYVNSEEDTLQEEYQRGYDAGYKKGVQDGNTEGIKQAQKENEAQIKSIQEEHQAELTSIRDENQAELDSVRQENQDKLDSIQQEYQAELEHAKQKFPGTSYNFRTRHRIWRRLLCQKAHSRKVTPSREGKNEQKRCIEAPQDGALMQRQTYPTLPDTLRSNQARTQWFGGKRRYSRTNTL